MLVPRTEPDARVVQEALELRHTVEQMTDRCRHLYEEANEVVERLRHLRSFEPPTADTKAAAGAANGPGKCPRCGARVH
jgi:hypothetical protein